ncbi:MAG TPA: HAD hydrolase-like protein, partial [Tepidisphaeraceae bacterium]
MPLSIQAVFFDVDGVLIDSLPQHLQICRDKAKEFKLNLNIPDVETFRRMISGGTKVSPMKDFFLAVGFSPVEAERAVIDYERDFMQKYRPAVFPGVDEMLRKLHESGLKLGLVTSNTRANVIPALGGSMKYFDEANLFFFDRQPTPKTKSEWLIEGARQVGIEASNCVYVGDQPADAAAAKAAGFNFLGVTYGWGIPSGDTRFQVVDKVGDIVEKIAGMHKATVVAPPGGGQGTRNTPAEPTELAKLQFDYAWKWFSFHADQRTKLFNFMLIVFGVISAAVGGALDRDPNKTRPFAAFILCMAGTIVAIAFFQLDYRNRKLVERGEKVLEDLEEMLLFPRMPGGPAPKMILKEETDSTNLISRTASNFWRGKHRL